MAAWRAPLTWKQLHRVGRDKGQGSDKNEMDPGPSKTAKGATGDCSGSVTSQQDDVTQGGGHCLKAGGGGRQSKRSGPNLPLYEFSTCKYVEPLIQGCNL